MKNVKFSEYFHQLEGFHLLSERFYDDLEHYEGAKLAIVMADWMEAAFEAGYERAEQDIKNVKR